MYQSSNNTIVVISSSSNSDCAQLEGKKRLCLGLENFIFGKRLLLMVVVVASVCFADFSFWLKLLSISSFFVRFHAFLCVQLTLTRSEI